MRKWNEHFRFIQSELFWIELCVWWKTTKMTRARHIAINICMQNNQWVCSSDEKIGKFIRQTMAAIRVMPEVENINVVWWLSNAGECTPKLGIWSGPFNLRWIDLQYIMRCAAHLRLLVGTFNCPNAFSELDYKEHYGLACFFTTLKFS